MAPNVLFITVDQMRGDCLSLLNHPIIETPNLDHLAQKGVLFTQAHSATPVCIPARAAIMTGLTQRSHGRVGYQDNVPWNYENIMPESFSKAGYHTQCVGKLHVYPTRSLCGFHNVILHDGWMHYREQNTPASAHWDHVDDYTVWLKQRAGVTADVMGELHWNSSTVARPWHLREDLHPTNWVVTQSIDFLRRRDPNKPFFLWMSFVSPHPPLNPPQVYYDQYIHAYFPDPVIGDWADTKDEAREGLNPTTFRGVVHKNMLHRARAAYYALITHIDYQIGRFLLAMEEYGVGKDTIVLFASDHGEMLGDHNLFRKGLPYEGSVKVPFILADLSPSSRLRRGSVVDRLVEMRDIMPTLLDAANIPIPDTVEGHSVIPLCRGEQTDWREYIHGENTFGAYSNHYITNGKEKYIWFSQTGEEQFFDLQDDPFELQNLANDSRYSKRIELRRQQLVTELHGREEGYSDGERLIVGRKPQRCLSHIL